MHISHGHYKSVVSYVDTLLTMTYFDIWQSLSTCSSSKPNQVRYLVNHTLRRTIESWMVNLTFALLFTLKKSAMACAAFWNDSSLCGTTTWNSYDFHQCWSSDNFLCSHSVWYALLLLFDALWMHLTMHSSCNLTKIDGIATCYPKSIGVSWLISGKLIFPVEDRKSWLVFGCVMPRRHDSQIGGLGPRKGPVDAGNFSLIIFIDARKYFSFVWIIPVTFSLQKGRISHS